MMSTRFALAFAAVTVVTATAHAQEAELPALKSERVATGASVAGTLVPIAMMVAASQIEDDATSSALALGGAAGLFIGPSAGHFYAGQIMTKGLALRLGGAMVVAGSLVAGFGDDCFLFCPDNPDSSVPYLHEDTNDNNEHWLGVAVIGVGVFAVGVIHDIATADNEARAYNRAHARTLTIAPTLGREQAGFAVVGTF